MEEYDSLDESRWPLPGPDAGAGPPTGIHGWKKRCLYALVVLLICVVTLNLTLFLWIMRVVHYNPNGVNYIQMVQNGIQLSRKTYVQDTLVAERVFSAKALSLQSAINLTLSTSDRAGHPASTMLMANGSLKINTPSFRVTNSSGHTLFAVDKDSINLTAHSVPIFGEGGTSLEGTLQTPKISSYIRSDLVLESLTRSVKVLSDKTLTVESLAGDILAACTEDITLTANFMDGSIRLESPTVLMPTLRHSQSEPPPPPSRHRSRAHQHQHASHASHTSHKPHASHALHASHASHGRKHRHRPERIYQLCICANGQLFLGEADAYCDTGVGNELCQ